MARTQEIYEILVQTTGSTAEVKALVNELNAANKALKNTKTEAQQAGRGWTTYNSGVKQANFDTRKFELQVQNAGYQISDFFVQIGGGTSMMRAFGQQFPQLVQGMGLLGIGAAVAVSAIAGLVQFFGVAGKEISDISKDLQDAADGFATFAKRSGDTDATLANVRDRFGEVTKETLELQRALDAIDLRGKFLDADEALNQLVKTLTGMRAVARLEKLLDLDRSATLFEETQQAAVKFRDTVLELNSAKGFDAQLDVLSRMSAQFTALVGDVNQMTRGQLEMYEAIKQAEASITAQKAAYDETSKSAARVKDEVDEQSVILDNQLLIYNALNDVAGERWRIEQETAAVLREQNRIYNSIMNSIAGGSLFDVQQDLYGDVAKDLENVDRQLKKINKSTGGGGKSGINQAERDLENFIRQLQGFRSAEEQAQADLDALNAAFERFGDQIKDNAELMGLFKRAQEELKEAIRGTNEDLIKASETIGGGIGDGLAELVTRTEKAGDAFKNMARTFAEAVGKMISQWISFQLISGLFGGGAAMSAGLSNPFAGISDVPMAPTASVSIDLDSLNPIVTTQADAPVIPTLPRSVVGMTRPSNNWSSGGDKSNVEVIINNNASGTEARAEERDGTVYVTVEDVRNIVANDMVTGGNNISSAVERTYRLSRGR